MSSSAARIGEVIETSSTRFVAHAVQLHRAPALGALVEVGGEDSPTIFGVVSGASTEGIGVGSRPVPRGRDGTVDAAIYREHPDLEHVLRTCFDCTVVGFEQFGSITHYLPASPAPIHYSVRLSSAANIMRFTRNTAYLRMLLDVQECPAEEVIGAHIRYCAEHQSSTDGRAAYAFVVQAGREVAGLLQDDHLRLMAILERIRRKREQ